MPADLSITLAGVLVVMGLATGLMGAMAGRQVAGRLADILGPASCMVAVAAWLSRWWSAGHLPLFGTYESALSLAVAVLLAGLLARRGLAAAAGIWAPAGGTAAFLVAHGLSYSTGLFALTISERSWVVEVHAWIAWAAFGALMANAGLAFLVLRGWGGEAVVRRMTFTLSLGFVLHSAMLASGSFYKFLLFGRTWSFDPIETLGLVAWVAYGTLLHMQLLAGWGGRRLAGWCMVLFVVLVISYRGIVYFPSWSTYHIFDVDLRFHE